VGRAWIAAIVVAGCGFDPAPTASIDADGAPDGDDRDGPAIDAPPADATECLPHLDAAPGMMVYEAEAFAYNRAGSTNSWQVKTDQECYSGNAFVEVAPDINAQCIDPAMLSGCPSLIYPAITLAGGGPYYVHARMMSIDSAEDSIWYGVNEVPQPMPINQNEQPTPVWGWVTGPTQVPLGTGTFALQIWMREDGARVDVIAMTTSPTPPW
jgi:hypothetical protein